MSTVADVLDRAADVIAERGHCRGAYVGTDGSVCLLGAIRFATTGNFYSPMQEPEGREAIRSLRRTIGTIVPIWNDAPERTAGEVIAALHEAARRERGAA